MERERLVMRKRGLTKRRQLGPQSQDHPRQTFAPQWGVEGEEEFVEDDEENQ